MQKIEVKTNKYSMEQAASKLAMTKRNLYSFLKKYNFIIGKDSDIKIEPSLLVMDYFTTVSQVRNVGKGYHKLIISIYVTQKGMKFLTSITKQLISKY